MIDTHICRLCGKAGYEHHKYPLIKYSTRHYAHADCALAKWGAVFFNRLTSRQASLFPALAAIEAGVVDALKARIDLKTWDVSSGR